MSYDVRRMYIGVQANTLHIQYSYGEVSDDAQVIAGRLFSTNVEQGNSEFSFYQKLGKEENVKNMIAVCSTYKGMSGATADLFTWFTQNKISTLVERTTTDVSLARNLALSQTCDVLREHSHLDTVLMIDDDMQCYDYAKDTQALVDHSRSTGVPASCVYCSHDNELCAVPYKDKWMVGLGFLAIPAKLLLTLQDKSFKFEIRGKICTEFTWSGVNRITGDWQAEAFILAQRLGELARWDSSDYRFTARLGGVDLLPSVILGHLKTVALTPSADAVAKVIAEAEKTRCLSGYPESVKRKQ